MAVNDNPQSSRGKELPLPLRLSKIKAPSNSSQSMCTRTDRPCFILKGKRSVSSGKTHVVCVKKPIECTGGGLLETGAPSCIVKTMCKCEHYGGKGGISVASKAKMKKCQRVGFQLHGGAEVKQNTVLSQ